MQPFDISRFIGAMPWMQQAAQGGKTGTTPTYGGDRVGPAPRGRVESPGMFSGGLLGNFGTPQQYQSFNPYGSPSANMFDQYMQQAMQQRGGPGGFFGFQPQQMKPLNSQPVPSGAANDGRLTWADMLAEMYNRTGGPTGGGQ